MYTAVCSMPEGKYTLDIKNLGTLPGTTNYSMSIDCLGTCAILTKCPDLFCGANGRTFYSNCTCACDPTYDGTNCSRKGALPKMRYAKLK
jgi:hypothetical protein